jgi:hypothetical protein
MGQDIKRIIALVRDVFTLCLAAVLLIAGGLYLLVTNLCGRLQKFWWKSEEWRDGTRRVR